MYSIRIPSSCCGLIGLKPSYGIGYCGEYPLLSHVCPLTINMDDLRLYMKFICNEKNCQQWSMRIPKQVFKTFNFSKEYILNRNFENKKKLRIGFSKTLNGVVPEKYIDPRVWKHILNAIKLLKNDGFNVEQAEPKFDDGLRKRYFFIMANLWRVSMFHGYAPFINDKNEHLIDPVLMRIVKKGKAVTSNQLYQSLKDRDDVKKAVNKYFDNYDILITPTLPILPPPAWTTKQESTPMRMKIPGLMGTYTGMFNLTHNPAITINCAYEKGNIPVGLQIIGKMYKDDDIMRFAHNLQELCMKLVVAKL